MSEEGAPTNTKGLAIDPRLSLVGAALLAVGLSVACQAAGLPPGASTMAGIAALMAALWVTELVPIPVTSLLPLVLFPLFGVADLATVSASYGKPVVFLFLGGFFLALALQRSQLHRRIALSIVGALGSRPDRLILGFMLASGFLSMWISNTASVLVMMPIGLAVLEAAKGSGAEATTVARVGTAMMLGIAYAADIGGMATPVGTPPNLVLLELYPQLQPGAPPIGFGQWMMLGLPLSALFMSSGWFLLTHVLFRFDAKGLFGGGDVIERARAGLGPVRRDELVAGGIFGVTALLWMCGGDLRLGLVEIAGWRSRLGLEAVGDAAVAIAAAALLFAIPSRDHVGERMLTWETSKSVPWGLLLLFGGGFALAAGFERSGLSVAIGHGVQGLAGVHPVLLVVVVSLMVTFLTEVTSNTATTTLVLPILAQAGESMGINPLVLMIPATLSASCAFMMPVASPTQAIVFGSGYVNIRQMVRAGIGFNLLGVALVSALFLLLGPWVFGIAW